MKARQALRVLAELTSVQWGLVTSGQAGRRGVSRLDLARLADAGLLERVSHGVYRDAGAAPDTFDELRIAWLSLEPKVEAHARLTDLSSVVVVSGISAATLHGIGDLRSDRHEFTTPVRRQSQRKDFHFIVRPVDQSQITLREGLPVTTVERTLADLIASHTDLTHVASALGDALRRGSIELGNLALLLAPLAGRNGLKTNDGAGFVDHLLKLAGMDADATVERITAMDSLAAAIAARYLEKHFAALKLEPMALDSVRALSTTFEHMLQPQRDTIASISAAFVPLQEQRRKIAEIAAPMITAAAAAASFADGIKGNQSVGSSLAINSGEAS
jgi:hypothetical protein